MNVWILTVLCLVSVAYRVTGYVVPSRSKDDTSYADKDPSCHSETKAEFVDWCEPYKERTCLTQNKEKCTVEEMNNCTSAIETNIERACFDVKELVCSLKEVIHYDTVGETYQIMSCFYSKDMICDTVYNMESTPTDDYQCLSVETPNCHLEEQVINDVICTHTVDFDCSKEVLPDMYKSNVVACARFPRKDCYNIPRKVMVETCKQDYFNYCEKFTNVEPLPVEDQNCHFEPKKLCFVRNMKRIRKVKKYSYVNDCKQVARQICEQVEKHTVQPRCHKQERLKCSYEPVEICKETDELYCQKVEEVTEVEVCENKFATTYL